MLSFETPSFEIEGITVFPDDVDKLLFYYAAGAPQVTLDPRRRPVFDLWIYREDQVHDHFGGTQIPEELGAGFLTFGVDCRRDERELRDIRKGLADLLDIDDEDTIKLAQVPYHAGKVSLIALDAVTLPSGDAPPPSNPAQGRPKFITDVMGAATPQLLGDLNAIFSLSLSERGAGFMAGLFENGATPIGVVYELEYYGLSAAVDVTVRADMSRIKTHFGAGLQGSVQYFKADISAALDFLHQENAVTVESKITVDSDAAREAEQRAIAMFKEDIIQQLFRPSAPVVPRPNQGQDLVSAITGGGGRGNTAAGGAAQAGVNAVTGGSIGLTMKFEHEITNVSGVYNYSARMPVKRTDAPQAFLQTLVSKADAEDHTTLVDLGTASDFFDRVEAMISLPDDDMFETLNMREAVVSVSFGDGDPDQPPEVKGPFICRPGGERHRRVAFNRDGRASRAVSYGIEYTFDDDPADTVDKSQYKLPRRITSNGSIPILPTSDFGYRTLRLRTGRIPVEVTEIDVTAGFRTEDGAFNRSKRFRLKAPFDRPMDQVAPEGYEWPIRTRNTDPGQFEVQETFIFADRSSFAAPVRTLDTSFHTIDAPFAGHRELLIQPNIPTDSIEALEVELEYEDAEAGYSRRFHRRFERPFQSQTLRFPVIDPDIRVIRGRATMRDGGLVTTGEWEPIETPTWTPGFEVARAGEVTVRLIGGQLDALGFDAVLVELRAPDETGTPKTSELFFAPGDPLTATVTIVASPGAPMAFEFRSQVFKSDGSHVIGDWAERADTQNLIISLRSL